MHIIYLGDLELKLGFVELELGSGFWGFSIIWVSFREFFFYLFKFNSIFYSLFLVRKWKEASSNPSSYFIIIFGVNGKNQRLRFVIFYFLGFLMD